MLPSTVSGKGWRVGGMNVKVGRVEVGASDSQAQAWVRLG